jgi:hypothetical protein
MYFPLGEILSIVTSTTTLGETISSLLLLINGKSKILTKLNNLTKSTQLQSRKCEIPKQLCNERQHKCLSKEGGGQLNNICPSLLLNMKEMFKDRRHYSVCWQRRLSMTHIESQQLSTLSLWCINMFSFCKCVCVCVCVHFLVHKNQLVDLLKCVFQCQGTHKYLDSGNSHKSKYFQWFHLKE